MDRTITVTGAGKAYDSPDRVRLNGQLSGVCRSYSEAVDRSASAVASLKKAVGEAGFDMDSLKTAGISVSARYETEGGIRRFIGYGYSHEVTMVADIADGGLGRLLDALLGCEDAPEFNVSYEVSDPAAPIAEARAAAVKDAKHRARELADVAGVKLGQIVSISYVSSPCNVGYGRMMMLSACDGITPEDAEYNDSVTVEWMIAD